MIQSMQTVFKYINAIPYANIIAAIEDFVVSKEINYIYIASSQTNLFYLTFLLLWIFLNMRRHYVSYVRVKKASYGSFYKDEWFLDSSVSAYFT